MQDPLVSVVVPALNGERHIEGSVASALNQTYTNIEVVVSDAGSTDRTAEIVRSFDDSRVRLLVGPVGEPGIHANWTRGVAAARGDFVKILCHDDLLFPHCLAVQTQLLLRNPRAVLASGRRQIINDNGDVLIKARGLSGLTKGEQPLVTDGGSLARACTRAGTNLLGEPASVLVRRSALPELLFDPRWRYAIDLDFYLRCLEHGDAVLDSRVLCSFRVSPKQLSAVLTKSQAREMKALFAETALRYPHHVSDADVRLGSARALLLAQARRMLYRQMRMRSPGTRPRNPEGSRTERVA